MLESTMNKGKDEKYSSPGGTTTKTRQAPIYGAFLFPKITTLKYTLKLPRKSFVGSTEASKQFR